MGTTARLALPYPELTGAPDVPADIRALALALDNAAIVSQGTLASRPVSTGGSPGKMGRWYYATDNGLLYYDFGTGWITINAPGTVDGPAGTGTLRTLGTGALQAAAGNDARLSDQRTPVDASVTAAKIAAALKPSGGAGGATEALRALGTTPGTAAAGDDGRFITLQIPPGGIMAYAKAAAPAGWLTCDGSPVSRATYAALFAAIGVVYGAGDGINTFNIPDLRGRVPVGVDGAAARMTANDALAQAGGTEAANMPAHNHGGATGGMSANNPHAHSAPSSLNFLLNDGTNQFAASAGTTLKSPQSFNGQTANTDIAHTHSIPSDGGGANNMPPYQVVTYIIKT